MLVIMKKSATEADLEGVKRYIVDHDFDFHQSTGVNRIIIGVIGDATIMNQDDLRKLPGVLEVFKIPDEHE